MADLSGGGANLGTARGSITLDSSGLAKGIVEAKTSLLSFERQAQSFAKALDDVSRSALLIGGGIAAGLGLAVNSFATFESQLSGLQAVSGANAAQMEQFKALALQIGQDTTFTASEAASALTELAKAGIPLPDILNGAAAAAVNLAQATGITIPEAASVMSASMAVFQKTGADAADVADRFVAVANATRADVAQLAQGLAQSANVAQQFGISFEDTIGILGLFSQFGLDASDAGTSLKTMLLAIATPTKQQRDLMAQLNLQFFDAKGNFIGLAGTAQQLQDRLSGLTQEERANALGIIFGNDAIRAANILYQSGAPGVAKYTSELNASGEAQKQAAIRMDNLKGSLEQLRGSIEVVAIGFGSALAPAVRQVADTLTGLANGFTALPGPVQSTAAAALAAAAGFALLTAGTSKLVSFALETVKAWKQLAITIRESAAAMSVLNFAITPLGIGLATLAAVTVVAIIRHRDHENAVNSLKDAFASLNETVQQFKLNQIFGPEELASIDSVVEHLGLAVNEVTKLRDAAKDRVDIAQGIATDQNNPNQRQAENDLAGLRAELESFGDPAKVFTDATKLIEDSLRQPNVDIPKLTAKFEELIATYKSGGISGPEFVTSLQTIRSNISDYALTADKATGATKGLTDAEQAQADITAEAEKAAERFAEQLGEIEVASLLAVAGLEDIAPSLDGVQTGFGKVGDSIEEVTLKMDDLGVVDLSESNRRALEFKDRLNDVEDALGRVQGAIQNNSDDMAMWNGNISLVDDTLGTAEDGYANLTKLVNDGKLTQEEANNILKEGIFLRERSVGGLEDEAAEQAKNIPILAEYVRQHDAADGAVKNLTSDQQGFIAAMQTSQVQTTLQTAQLLLYLAQMGQIPPEKVTEFLVDSADSDPIIKGILEDLGLLPDPDHPKEIPVKVIGGDDATSQLDDVGGAVKDVPDEKNVKVTVSTDTGAAADIGDPVAVPSALGTPDDTNVVNYKPATIIIPTQLAAPDKPAPQTDTGADVATGSATPATISTTVTIDDDAASRDLAALNTALDTMDARSVSAEVTLDDKASTQIEELTGAITALTTLPFDVEITITDGATTPVSDLTSALDDINDFSFNVDLTLSDAASAPISTLKGVLDDWPTTVETEAKFDGTTAESDATTSAGNILDNLDIRALAGGLGFGIGDALGSGINSGAGAWGSAIAATVVAAVNNAVAAGRSAADAKSPSRKTEMLIGLPLSQGIAVGVTRGAPTIARAMRGAIGAGLGVGFDPFDFTAGLSSLPTFTSAQASPIGVAGAQMPPIQIFALKSDEYERLLSGAESGALSHDWLSKLGTSRRTMRAASVLGG